MEINENNEKPKQKEDGDVPAEMKHEKHCLNLPRKPQIMCFIGKPESGKSHLIKSMLYDYAKHKYFKFGVTFVRTKFNHDYDYLPDRYVSEDFDIDKLKKHINKLRDWRKKNNKKVPPNFVIFDDLLGQIDWYDQWMTNWVASFRHTSTSIFITAQYLQSKGGISTVRVLRECTNLAFIFNTKFKNSLKGLFEAYGQLFDNYDDFVRHFQKITRQKHHCLIYKADEEDISYNYLDFIAPKDIPEYQLKYKI